MRNPPSKLIPGEFKQRVLNTVARIPKGQTLTYARVAALAGSPKACRAVGNILNKNRDPNVPCHRVIRSDGKPGGYAFGGESAKKKILHMEGSL